ncbi:MAG: hypothetical protein V5A44_09225 [Haloarculaceae archaeon]
MDVFANGQDRVRPVDDQAKGIFDDVVGGAEDAFGLDEYNVWMSGAAGLALLDDRTSIDSDIVEAAFTECLDNAQRAGGDVDWANRDQLEETRRNVILQSEVKRAIQNLTNISPTAKLPEPKSYAATVTTAEENAEEAVERALDDEGFRRNPVAHLKYRYRNGEKEYEQGSWTYREEVDAEKQLHVRLYDGDKSGTVDLYAHYENSNIRGDEHFAPQDFGLGVCSVREQLEEWAAEREDTEIKRAEHLPGDQAPRTYDCSSKDTVL